MKGIKDLSRAERFELKILLNKGYSRRAIAHSMGRGKSTIAREILLNSTRGVYDPRKAHAKTRLRTRMRRFQYCKIEEATVLKRFIIEKLKVKWNPDEIAGYLKRHQKKYPWYASKTAIYQWLRTTRGERYCVYLYSKRRRVKHHKNTVVRVMIPNRVSIHERFLGATNRSRYGHWEADTVVGKRGTRCGVKTAIERKSKLFVAYKVSSMRPSEHSAVLRDMTLFYTTVSITYDNGIENKEHEAVGVPGFFADPYCSNQRGSNEHGNKMFRWPFPKRTDFTHVSQKQIDYEVSLINKKPRKILGYRSALEVATEAGIIKSLPVEVS